MFVNCLRIFWKYLEGESMFPCDDDITSSFIFLSNDFKIAQY